MMTFAYRLVVAALVVLTVSMTAGCDSAPPQLPTDTSPMAIHDLLTGTAGRGFLGTITKFKWDDDGAKAAAIFEWIGKDAGSADPAVATRAGEAARAIAQFLSAQGNELLELPSGLFGWSHQTLGELNPVLTRALVATLTPFLAPLVCSTRETRGFSLIDPAGCGESVDAAEPIFTVLNTDRQAGQTLIDATNAEIDRQVHRYADADLDRADAANPALIGLTYAGRLLGLAAVGGQRSGIPIRSLQEELNLASCEIVGVKISKGQTSVRPEFMEGGRLMAPGEVRAKQGADMMDEYYGSVNNSMIALGLYSSLLRQLGGEYKSITGYR